MNDFTKEELENLLKCIRLIEMDFTPTDSLIKLKLKLQAMIDNYCEHEFKSTKGSYFTCSKCGDVE